MLAAKGYDGDVRSRLLMKGIVSIIPSKSNRKQSIECALTL